MQNIMQIKPGIGFYFYIHTNYREIKNQKIELIIKPTQSAQVWNVSLLYANVGPDILYISMQNKES